MGIPLDDLSEFAASVPYKSASKCQSCGIRLIHDVEGGGSNRDGTRSSIYCSHCFRGGHFVDGDITIGELRNETKGRLAAMGYPGFVTSVMTMGMRNLDRWRTSRDLDFAFEILRVLFENGLSGGADMVISDAVSIAGDKCDLLIRPEIRSAAVADLVAGGFVDTWDGPDGVRYVKINVRGILKFQSRVSELASEARRKSARKWAMVGVLLGATGLVFVLLRLRVFGR